MLGFQAQLDLIAHIPMLFAAVLAPWVLVTSWIEGGRRYAALRAELGAA